MQPWTRSDTRDTDVVDLSILFAQQQASRIDWDGPVFSLYELPTHTTRLGVEFMRAGSELRQGVRLKIRGGKLEANGVATSDLVLWQDSSPTCVDVLVRWGKQGSRSLRVWNCWEVNGVMHAWLGNAGMRVERTPEGVIVLNCSDGRGEPDFGDLLVKIAPE
ncbi:hypothetical protein GXB85_11155 [Cellulomonas sp. APG4]|uniref:hypothetical protein n=1 Tax=Cellulomonas sp. APG4 TaxID=1538656 RepID=UPI00137B6A21|nr:hypothetical protein [Cellulomonas sp. APG4]NCT91505.1 hypothetical protein [Cellulomonas sp. APG4]